MLRIQFNIKCILCGNSDALEYYIYPEEQNTASFDKINNPSKYKLSCKKCGKEYHVSIIVTA